MRKNTLLMTALVSLLIVVGSIIMLQRDRFDTVPDIDKVVVTIQPSKIASMVNKDVVINLVSQNDSEQSGKATLSEVNGRVKVDLEVTRGDFIDPQPAHIHLGSCLDLGDIIYPLSDIIEGKSTTTLEVTMVQLRSQGQLAINIHRSLDEINSYTACGDIQ